MDVWIHFAHATQWQAEGIFKRFFPYKPPCETASSHHSQVKESESIPIFSEDEIFELAKRFAASIPEEELSVGCPRMPNLKPLLIFPSGCMSSRLFVKEQDSPT
jgi:hypothetical protein